MTNKTALAVVDLQNQYTDPKGCLYSACVGEHLPAILAGIEKLREKGVRIIYAVNEATGDEFSYDTEVLKRRDPIPMAGTWEAALNAKVIVRPEDLVLSHYASSAFFWYGDGAVFEGLRHQECDLLRGENKYITFAQRQRTPCGTASAQCSPAIWWLATVRRSTTSTWKSLQSIPQRRCLSRRSTPESKREQFKQHAREKQTMKFSPVYYIINGWPTVDKTIEMTDRYVEHGVNAIQICMPSKNPWGESKFIQDRIKHALDTYGHDYTVFMDCIREVRRRHPDWNSIRCFTMMWPRDWAGQVCGLLP